MTFSSAISIIYPKPHTPMLERKSFCHEKRRHWYHCPLSMSTLQQYYFQTLSHETKAMNSLSFSPSKHPSSPMQTAKEPHASPAEANAIS
jgi:hypothetical protein